MKKHITLSLLCLSVLSLCAQINPVDKNGIAIGGYDIVTYFDGTKPAKGNEAYTSKYESATYYFASPENQKLFTDNPKKYIPQYDGYCALAVSYGKKISIDPLTYKIKEGKLYLFFNGKTSHGRLNSLDTWNKNEEKLLKKADINWPDVKKAKYKPEESL
jgi:YHS domain-containing protein